MRKNFETFAQHINVRIQTFHIGVELVAPNFFKNRGAGQGVVEVEKQHFKQSKLFFAQMNFGVAVTQSVEIAVDLKALFAVNLVDKRFVFEAANGVEAGKQLFDFIGFDYKVVSAGVEGIDAVIKLAFGGDKNNAALIVVFTA